MGNKNIIDQRYVAHVTKFDKDYRLNLQNGIKAVYCFFEGEGDIEFYRKFIQLIFHDAKFFAYNCGGITFVEAVYSSLLDKSKNWTDGYTLKNSILFFYDKDYNGILDPDWIIEKENRGNCFVTKYHSIENYLVTPQVFERMIIHFLRIFEEKKRNNLSHNFEKQYSEFNRLMKPILAVIISDRNFKGQLDLGKFNLYNLFYVNNKLELKEKIRLEKELWINQSGSKKEESTYRDSFSYLIEAWFSASSKNKPEENHIVTLIESILSEELKEIIKDKKRLKKGLNQFLDIGISIQDIAELILPHITNTDNYESFINHISEQILKLENYENGLYMRGHFAMWFFINYYTMCKTDTDIKLIESNAIRLLVLFLDCPEDLKLFLETNYNKSISK